MAQSTPFIHLKSSYISVIIDCREGVPAILYFGQVLGHSASTQMLSKLSARQEPKCALAKEVPLSLSPSVGDGFTGSPGIELSGGTQAWSVNTKLVSIEQDTDYAVRFVSVDEHRSLILIHDLAIDLNSHVLSASTHIKNKGEKSIIVNRCSAPTLTVPDHISKIMSFEGRWSMEFQQTSVDLFLGAYVRENRKGKTSHDNFPGVILHDQYANQMQGECYGFHLGWSGNHQTRVELLPEQRTYIQMGELLTSDEIELHTEQSYRSPTLYATYSHNGFNELSHHFHDYVRQNLVSTTLQKQPRPVFYNTWEGIYFDHDLDTLKRLADISAQLGTERFVLDDGWFKGRNSDKSSLGDWEVDKQVYPQGLSPIINYVKSLGMSFGIWFEPEMVNPDSDLFRAHPDWVLSISGHEPLLFRNQLVLDLTRKDVQEYLYNKISQILNEYPDIEFIKWDMNRDINHTGNTLGISAIHLQTKAVYALIEKLKAAHPQLEIESCSSGGGRADYGVLAHTDRIWTSDSNDAIDRLHIQRGASYFLPLELLGAHVGPRKCHITGRHLDINTRVATAFFGSFGMEMDPRELSDVEIEALQAAITLYKKYRALLHTGDLYRLNDNPNSVNYGVLDKTKENGLFAYNSVNETRRTQPPKYRFIGLNPDFRYRFNLVWPTTLNEYTPSLLNDIEGQVFNGEILMQHGMQLPISFPQQGFIFSLHKV